MVWLALSEDGERGCGFTKEMRQAAVAGRHRFQLGDRRLRSSQFPDTHRVQVGATTY
jgi:hypothetical protein